jgi:hypothetical protein
MFQPPVSLLLAFAALLIVLGFAAWAIVYRTKHKEKLVEADIRSAPDRFNVAFQR